MRLTRDRRRRSSFDESAYLDANPDVAAAVAAGQWASGFDHYEATGQAEGRRFDRDPTRFEIVSSMIDVSGRGLELGPLNRPIMAKRDGFDVQIVDYLDTEALRAKYNAADHPDVDPSTIEEVDFVSQGEPLCELIGEESAFDWVVASHVIEHIPDLVAFFQDVARILRPDGRLALLVPDKRYTFDYYGELSTTGQLLDAHLERRTRPTPGQAFDYFARAASLAGTIALVGVHRRRARDRAPPRCRPRRLRAGGLGRRLRRRAPLLAVHAGELPSGRRRPR